MVEKSAGEVKIWKKARSREQSLRLMESAGPKHSFVGGAIVMENRPAKTLCRKRLVDHLINLGMQ